MDFVEQTFDVRLFDDDKDPLNKATDMLHMINKIGEDGKKHKVHKVKTRNILSQDYEIQYSIKQGTNWLNMTKHYRSTRK